MFRSTKGGGASAWLSAGEATLLRTLVVPVMELLTDPARPAPPAEPAPADGAATSDDLFADLEKMFNEAAAEPPEAPADPVLARLLPDAYTGRSRGGGRVPQVHRAIAARGEEVLRADAP